MERQKPRGAAGFAWLIPARDRRILRGSKARKPGVAANRGAIRAAQRKRQAGIDFGMPQGSSEHGPYSARNSGEEQTERKKLRRVNPKSGCLERSRLRESMHNRQGRPTSKAAGPGGIPAGNIDDRKRCRGAKAQESRGDSQGSSQPIRVILCRRTEAHESRSRRQLRDIGRRGIRHCGLSS